jgi:type IV pilus assembly protein PilZ
MYHVASEETYKDGQIIFQEGTYGDWVYVIKSGSVEISKTVRGEKVIIAVLEPGQVFGELGYLGAIKRTARARAIGETSLGVIDRSFLDKEFNRLSEDFRTIVVAAVKRFGILIDRTSEFSSRKEARAQKSLSLSFKDRDSFIKAYTGNISRGGLFIKTERLLKEGEKFALKLHLPELSKPMKFDCEVAWTREQSETEKRPSGMGVKFCEMSRQDSQILNRYVQTLIKGE